MLYTYKPTGAPGESFTVRKRGLVAGLVPDADPLYIIEGYGEAPCFLGTATDGELTPIAQAAV